MLPVVGIGVSFGIVVETELEATARTNNVCRATMFVVRRLRQTVISANGTDKIYLSIGIIVGYKVSPVAFQL